MPISPTPPSGANTSSPCGPAIATTSPPRTRRPPPRPALSHRRGGEPSGPSRRCSRTGRQARHRPILTRIGLPTPAARASQSARIAAKPAPRFHCARRAIIAADSGANRLSGEVRTPAVARSVAGVLGAVRMMHAIDADADRDGRPLALDQDAGELVAVDQQIVRPFQHEPRWRGPGCARRWRRAERAPRRTTARESAPAAPDRSAAGSRRDCRAPTPRCGRGGRAPRSGVLRGDPQRPALAGAREPQRLRVGRADRVVSDEPRPGRHSPWDRAASEQRFRRDPRRGDQRRGIDEVQTD